MSEMTQALLNPVPPAGDEARIDAIFKQVESAMGLVPDGLRLYSISPPLLESFMAYVGYFRQHPTLSGQLLAMIRYLGSAQAGCRFCIDMNEGFLVQMGADLDEVRAAREDASKAPLPDNEKVLLNLALKAVNDPDGVNQADLDAARGEGWTDRDLFDVVVQAGNNRAFNYVLKTFKVEHQGVFS
ncbi:carboxymuconolactone decarboxylase family protein [Thiothrix nivea]|uniref:Alkylhydroperoxidase like protein, AhpD family n=1 Tax=Thiothrix nivea (strain ATCC 35100 / DSM 5205 / JP2) TaxID=870187 RepID=A0A656HHR5_THINJ|nr:carboxymuconolactone decarboxylase family protein [Thiothrix nivea]EIJ34759.1 hypothetical protein Thini_2194 [Thiothrix nivea DSM 5205]